MTTTRSRLSRPPDVHIADLRRAGQPDLSRPKDARRPARAGRLLRLRALRTFSLDGRPHGLHVGLPGRHGYRARAMGGPRPRSGQICCRALPRERPSGGARADRSADRPVEARCAVAGGPARRAPRRRHRRERLPTLSTLAPVSNECYVGPYYPRKAGEEKFALTFVIPMNTPGLSILCRESFHHGESAFDRPLSARFDEGDAILMFDKVFVPSERVIVDGDIAAYNAIMGTRPGFTSLQACTRSTMKLRFLVGMATAVARANGRDRTSSVPGCDRRIDRPGQHCRGNPVRASSSMPIAACRRSSRGRCRSRATGSPKPGSSPARGNAAVNFFFPYANTKAVDVLRLAAGLGRACHDRGRLRSIPTWRR